MNRLVLVNNGQNETGAQQLDTGDEGEEYQFLLVIIILIVVTIIVGLLAMFIIIRRGRMKIKEYVPEGRIEPLEEVEARLKPALAAGAPIQHAQLPSAPGVAIAAGIPGLPPAMPIAGAPTPATTPMPLPAATPAAGPGLPALPPATPQAAAAAAATAPAPTPTTAQPPEPRVGYGLYSPQAPSAQPVNVDQAGGYQPQPPAKPAESPEPASQATETKPTDTTDEKESN
jgi:hypothetical protein